MPGKLCGYRVQDRVMSDTPPPPSKAGVVHTVRPTTDIGPREQATNIGPTVLGRTPCFPDGRDSENYVRAALYRVLQLVGPEELDHEMLTDLAGFVLRWCRKYLLVQGAPMPFSAWIESRPYPQHRKEELRLAHAKALTRENWDYEYISCFLKGECYQAFKDPRLINSRSDEFKCLFGPWCTWMESIVYRLPMFAKHIRVRDRPKIIENMISHMPVQFVSDYSRFESSMRPELMEAIECVVYTHFGVPQGYMNVITGKNHLCARKGVFEAVVYGSRMSGEMNTSLGNGLTNYLMFAYYAHCHGLPIVGMVEGDDGIYGSTQRFDPKWFLKLGFKVELIEDKPVNAAGFCRQFWTSDGTVVTDLYRLTKLGWTMHLPKAASLTKKKELFAAICLSLGHELGGSPIFWAFAKKYGRSGKVPLNWWELNEAQTLGIEYEIKGHWIHLKGEAPWQQPSLQTREEYSLMFGISVGAQLAIEKQVFDGNWFIDVPELNIEIDKIYPDMREAHDRFVLWS